MRGEGEKVEESSGELQQENETAIGSYVVLLEALGWIHYLPT